MQDTHGFKQDDFNPCFHEKFTGSYKIPGTIGWIASDGYHLETTSFDRELWDPLEDLHNLNLPLGSWIDDFGARAKYHYTVLVDTEFSVINFIIELIQLFEGNASILERLKKTMEDAIGLFRRKFQETGNYWLSWNFAIKPTIGDIKAMLSSVKKAYKRLAWLRERNHKNTKVKYREGPRKYSGIHQLTLAPVTYGSRISPPPSMQDWPDWLFLIHECELDYKAEVRLSSWAWIRFDIEDELLEGIPGLGIVLSAMQGIYNPLEIAWEAIPFSWLIDWFRSEGHKLSEKLKSDLNPFGHAQIIQAGWTFKCKIEGTVYNLNGMECPDDSLDPTPPRSAWSRVAVGTMKYELFNRRPDLPPEESSTFSIPLRWYNASILAALIQQWTRRG